MQDCVMELKLPRHGSVPTWYQGDSAVMRNTDCVIKELNELLHTQGFITADNGAESFSSWGNAITWPEGRWISVYVVQGASEGWYVHIDVIQGGAGIDGRYDKNRFLVAMSKCWNAESAWRLAAAAAMALGA